MCGEPDLEEQKELVFHTAVVTAWVTTRMERDKTLVVLSAGGIGLIVTLLTTTGPHSSCCLLVYLLATIAFLAAIALSLCVLGRNADYLQRVAQGDHSRDPLLRRLDTLVMVSFFSGVVLAITVGVVSAQTRPRFDGGGRFEWKEEQPAAVPGSDRRTGQAQAASAGDGDSFSGQSS